MTNNQLFKARDRFLQIHHHCFADPETGNRPCDDGQPCDRCHSAESDYAWREFKRAEEQKLKRSYAVPVAEMIEKALRHSDATTLAGWLDTHWTPDDVLANPGQVYDLVVNRIAEYGDGDVSVGVDLCPVELCEMLVRAKRLMDGKEA